MGDMWQKLQQEMQASQPGWMTHPTYDGDYQEQKLLIDFRSRFPSAASGDDAEDYQYARQLLDYEGRADSEPDDIDDDPNTREFIESEAETADPDDPDAHYHDDGAYDDADDDYGDWDEE